MLLLGLKKKYENDADAGPWPDRVTASPHTSSLTAISPEPIRIGPWIYGTQIQMLDLRIQWPDPAILWIVTNSHALFIEGQSNAKKNKK